MVVLGGGGPVSYQRGTPVGPLRMVQGYLTYKKRNLLGPYRRPMPRVLGVLRGREFSYGRGIPAGVPRIRNCPPAPKDHRRALGIGPCT